MSSNTNKVIRAPIEIMLWAAGIFTFCFLITLTANPGGYSESEIGNAIRYGFVFLIGIVPEFFVMVITAIISIVKLRSLRPTQYYIAWAVLVEALLYVVYSFTIDA